MRNLLLAGLLALAAVLPTASALTATCDGSGSGIEMDTHCDITGLPVEPTTFTIDCWSHDHESHYEAGCAWTHLPGPVGIVGTCVVQNKDGQYHSCQAP